jgi:transcriptional regulator with PAS, ATPase and Fis domain
MPALLQAKLLRVLEERSVRRLGGSQEIPIDVRVLAATNREPHEAVRAGAFREDLLYRLNVITIELPPLRQRKDDLPLLAQHLITQLAERHERPARHLSAAALEVLRSHSWPGNVRELRNVIERAVIICSGRKHRAASHRALPARPARPRPRRRHHHAPRRHAHRRSRTPNDHAHAAKDRQQQNPRRRAPPDQPQDAPQ